jgi:carbon-monoxide dehydrogenase medium subunit
MTLPAFGYAAPPSVAEAVELLADPAAAVLAGGHSLLYTMKTGQAAPSTLVDLRRITELRGIHPDGEGGLAIGAMTTLAELAALPELERWQPACAQALARIGDPQVRHRGTVGGNVVAGALPGGPALRTDLPAVLLAAEATLRVTGPDGPRSVGAEEFYDPRDGMSGPAEMLLEVVLPGRPGWSGGYEKLRDRAALAPVCAVAVDFRLDGRDRIEDCRIGLTGAVAQATRLPELERALAGTRPSRIGSANLPDVPVRLFLNRHGTGAEYLAGLTLVLVRRAIVRAAAAAEAGGAADGASG